MLFQLDVGSQALLPCLSYFLFHFHQHLNFSYTFSSDMKQQEMLMMKQEEQQKSVTIDTAQRFTFSPLIFLPEKRILDPLDPDDPELGL